MLSILRKGIQYKKLLSQLDEFTEEIMIGKDAPNTRTDNRANIYGSSNPNHLAPVNGSQVDIHSLEKSITDKARSELANASARVGTRVRDAILASMYKLVTPRVEVVLRSAIEFPVQDLTTVVFDPKRKEVWGNVEGL